MLEKNFQMLDQLDSRTRHNILPFTWVRSNTIVTFMNAFIYIWILHKIGGWIQWLNGNSQLCFYEPKFQYLNLLNFFGLCSIPFYLFHALYEL